MIYWKCPVCKSSWPAATTVEAYHNYRKANELHPDQRCDSLKENDK